MTARFPRMGSAKLIRILQKNGFVEKRQTGSHKIFFNPETRRMSPVPAGKKYLPIGTFKSIVKQAGIDVQELYS
jgi:mRNA interferase HicA